MAHERIRSVRPLYDKLIKASPILGIFGHRQVGKTTFINQVTQNYLTFDSLNEKKRAEKDSELFLASLKKHPFGIDECQMVPDLFPTLKEHVRKKKQPGQFILSGSVRFTSRKAIQESLAGRMMFFELYPLTISELDQRPLPDFFVNALVRNSFTEDFFESLSEKELRQRIKSTDQYLAKGGMPGICFLREHRLMLDQLKDLHRLMLDRDLRMVYETKLSLEKLQALLGLIATFGWQGYSYTQVKNEIGMNPNTQKAILYALESIFLIRRIPIYGGSKGEIILLEDQFEEMALSTHSSSMDDALTSLTYRNLRAQFHYRLGMPVTIKSYWTRNNARVPIVISNKDHTLGIICIEAEEPSLSQLRAADSLLKAEGKSKVLILSKARKSTRVINSRVAIAPLVSTI
jgi:hypothetical protein